MKRPPTRRRTRFDWGRLEQRSVPTTLIALIDSGVDLTSAADAPYYNFSAAYDAYDKLAVTTATHGLVQDTSLQHGHGSTVADFIVKGIVAAEAQPGAGSLDVAILPIRDTPPGALSPDNGALVRGVYWAADHGASVINLSIRQYDQDFFDLDRSDPYYGFSLSRAISYARSKNVAVVTASGNEFVNVDGSNPYGSYILPGGAASPLHNGLGVPLDNILVTAAVDASNKLTPYTNWGPVTVNVGAPTATGTGAVTSYSTGYASGLAGVVSALTPSLTASQRIGLIEQSVTTASQSVGAWSTSGGVISPANAVAQAIGSVDLSGAYNVVGLTADGATASGNLDGSGHSFSANLVGSTVGAAGTVFSIGSVGSVDAISASGQTISLPSGNFGGLRLLATAVNGGQAGTFTVNYADNSSNSFTVAMSDWHSSPGNLGETLALATSYRNGSTGRDPLYSGFNLFSYNLALDPTRTVRSVTLPSNRNIVLFGVNVLSSSASAPNGATNIDLGGSYNAVGITADSSTGSGNIDGTGHSFSASLLGSSATVGGYSFGLGAAGSPDAVRATGQTIALPTGLFGSIRLLAVGVNGIQIGTFTVNYADGGSARFAQTLDDWHSSVTASGESLAASTTYRNGPGGRDSFYTGFNLFAYAFGIDPSRTVKSLTLPSNANIVLFAASLAPGLATPVSLAGVFNVVGITNDAGPGPGKLDGIDASYSASLVGPTVSAEGTTFILGQAGSPDAISASGQKISLPSGKFRALDLLASGVNGTQTGTFTVNYTDGSNTTVTQAFSDWHYGPNATGESAALAMSYRNRTVGRDNQAFFLYDYAFPLDPSRTIASITLPNNGNIAVFALNLVP